MQGHLKATFRQVRGASRRQRCRCTAGSVDYRQREPKDIRVLVVGATGYIGKFVVKELIKRGYNVLAFAREKSGVGGKAGMEHTKQASHAAQGMPFNVRMEHAWPNYICRGRLWVFCGLSGLLLPNTR